MSKSPNAAAAAAAASGVAVGGETGTKPTITLPDGPPPDELVVLDIVDGEGVQVPVGATVTTH